MRAGRRPIDWKQGAQSTLLAIDPFYGISKRHSHSRQLMKLYKKKKHLTWKLGRPALNVPSTIKVVCLAGGDGGSYTLASAPSSKNSSLTTESLSTDTSFAEEEAQPVMASSTSLNGNTTLVASDSTPIGAFNNKKHTVLVPQMHDQLQEHIVQLDGILAKGMKHQPTSSDPKTSTLGTGDGDTTETACLSDCTLHFHDESTSRPKRGVRTSKSNVMLRVAHFEALALSKEDQMRQLLATKKIEDEEDDSVPRQATSSEIDQVLLEAKIPDELKECKRTDEPELTDPSNASATCSETCSSTGNETSSEESASEEDLSRKGGQDPTILQEGEHKVTAISLPTEGAGATDDSKPISVRSKSTGNLPLLASRRRNHPWAQTDRYMSPSHFRRSSRSSNEKAESSNNELKVDERPENEIAPSNSVAKEELCPVTATGSQGEEKKISIDVKNRVRDLEKVMAGFSTRVLQQDTYTNTKEVPLPQVHSGQPESASTALLPDSQIAAKKVIHDLIHQMDRDLEITEKDLTISRQEMARTSTAECFPEIESHAAGIFVQKDGKGLDEPGEAQEGAIIPRVISIPNIAVEDRSIPEHGPEKVKDTAVAKSNAAIGSIKGKVTVEPVQNPTSEENKTVKPSDNKSRAIEKSGVKSLTKEEQRQMRRMQRQQRKMKRAKQQAGGVFKCCSTRQTAVDETAHRERFASF